MILSARPASTHGGAFGQSPQTLERDAMDAEDIAGRSDIVADEQNRVVLIPRRWDQVCR
jgi:hypothetical protein